MVIPHPELVTSLATYVHVCYKKYFKKESSCVQQTVDVNEMFSEYFNYCRPQQSQGLCGGCPAPHPRHGHQEPEVRETHCKVGAGEGEPGSRAGANI